MIWNKTVWLTAFFLWVLHLYEPYPNSGSTTAFVKTSVFKEWTNPTQHVIIYTGNWYGKESLTIFTSESILSCLKNEVIDTLSLSTQNSEFSTTSTHYERNLVLVGGIFVSLWAGWRVLITEKQSENLSNVKVSLFIFPNDLTGILSPN